MPYHYSTNQNILSKITEFVTFLYFLPQKWFRIRSSTIKSILIIEPFQMGDIVALTPMFEPLKKHFPEAEIFILTKKSNQIVLKYDERIIATLTADFSWSDHGKKTNKFQRLKNLYKSLKNIRKKYRFDIGIDPRGDIRSQIILKFLRCRETVAYTNYVNSNLNLNGLLLNKKVKRNPQYLHRYEWNCFILTALGIKESELFPIQMPSYQYKTLDFEEKTKPQKIVMHIGGGWVYKRWQKEKWRDVLLFLNDLEKFEVMVIGGPNEEDVLQEVEDILPKKINIPFKITSFDELIWHLQSSDLFIGLDSGPMNLASCLGKKTVTIFGPGDSEMWYPYHPESQWIHKKENFPCNPCLQQACIFAENNCSKQVEVDEVKMLIKKVLKLN